VIRTVYHRLFLFRSLAPAPSLFAAAQRSAAGGTAQVVVPTFVFPFMFPVLVLFSSASDD
jgi:hypothetical protein